MISYKYKQDRGYSGHKLMNKRLRIPPMQMCQVRRHVHHCSTTKSQIRYSTWFMTTPVIDLFIVWHTINDAPGWTSHLITSQCVIVSLLCGAISRGYGMSYSVGWHQMCGVFTTRYEIFVYINLYFLSHYSIVLYCVYLETTNCDIWLVSIYSE